MTRIFDLIFSTVAILILLPLLLPIMLVLLCTGEHHIFYEQERIGKNGEPFNVLKFATMLKNSPNLPGGFITHNGDPRILPCGHILRKTKINELPQLFNVWLGQMSIIGPRPVVASHFALYSEEQRSAISKMRPGLSGIGSLFFRAEERILKHPTLDPKWIHDNLAAPYKGSLEQWYSEHATILNYFKLIMLTAVAVIRPSFKPLKWFQGLPEPPVELRHHWA